MGCRGQKWPAPRPRACFLLTLTGVLEDSRKAAWPCLACSRCSVKASPLPSSLALPW